VVVCVFRTNQALSKDSKVREANLESLQRQLTSAQADNSAVAKAKEDVVRQLAQKTEHVNKLLPLEATNNQLKEQVQGSQYYVFFFFFLFLFFLFLSEHDFEGLLLFCDDEQTSRERSQRLRFTESKWKASLLPPSAPPIELSWRRRVPFPS